MFLLVELYEVPASPFLQPTEVSLDGRTNIWSVEHSFQFFITCKLAEGALCPSIQVIRKDVKWYIGPSIDLLGGPLVTVSQLDFVLWFSQFSIHLTVLLYSICFIHLLMRTLLETVLKALLKPS